MFNSVIGSTLTIKSLMICLLASIIFGLIISIVYVKNSECSKNFAITLAILPLLVNIVIMMVNGNIGAGVAVMGAFSLIRFRSQPGNSKEITAVFFAMAVGLAAGMGYIGFGAVFTLVTAIYMIILSISHYAERDADTRELKITIPEDQDYDEIYNDIFDRYLSKYTLTEVKTSNMGSLYDLKYDINLKDESKVKMMIDEIRTRNGNLTVLLRRPKHSLEEL